MANTSIPPYVYNSGPRTYRRTPRQSFMLFVVTGTPIIAALLVAIRFYGRRRLRIGLAWDDYLVALAAVLSLATVYPSWLNIEMWHFGHHVWTIRLKDIEPKMDYYYKVQLSYNMLSTPILPLVRASIMILLLRIGSVLIWVRRSIYVIFVLNVMVALTILFTSLFACPPKSGNNYADRVFGDLKCFGGDYTRILYVFYISANMFFDLLIFPIPFLMIYRLQHAKLSSKIIAIISFSLSLFATALGAWRLKVTYESVLFRRNVSDWTNSIDWCLNHAECNIAIMAACMPTLHHFFANWVNRDRSRRSGRSGSSGFGSGTSNAMKKISELGGFEANLELGPGVQSSSNYSKQKPEWAGSDVGILEETSHSPVSSFVTRTITNNRRPSDEIKI